MKDWIGFLGAAGLICGGALMNAPAPPPEVVPEPEVAVAPAPPTPAVQPDNKPGGTGAPSGG
jgi:hypothetical protein